MTRFVFIKDHWLHIEKRSKDEGLNNISEIGFVISSFNQFNDTIVCYRLLAFSHPRFTVLPIENGVMLHFSHSFINIK